MTRITPVERTRIHDQQNQAIPNDVVLRRAVADVVRHQQRAGKSAPIKTRGECHEERREHENARGELCRYDGQRDIDFHQGQ